MKQAVFILVAVLATPAFAAVKDCDALKAEIAAKLDARGLKGYTLEAVPADSVANRQVVGSCERGTKKIVYVRK